MKGIIFNHTFLIFLAFIAVLAVYLVLSILNEPIDDRLIGTVLIGLFGALAGKAVT